MKLHVPLPKRLFKTLNRMFQTKIFLLIYFFFTSEANRFSMWISFCPDHYWDMSSLHPFRTILIPTNIQVLALGKYGWVSQLERSSLIYTFSEYSLSTQDGLELSLSICLTFDLTYFFNLVCCLWVELILITDIHSFGIGEDNASL